jgi:hypothetical protein
MKNTTHPIGALKMTDLTAAHEAAHEENADRTMAALENAVGPDARDAARSAWFALPRFGFNAVIAYGGKVHRVYSPSRKFLGQPYCGSSRWNSARARATDAEVTCLKCRG